MSKSELKRLAAQMSDKDRADRLAARCASQMDKIAEQDARIKELEGALRVIVPYWTHAWDLVEGGLFIDKQSVEKFDAAFQRARAALKGEK